MEITYMFKEQRLWFLRQRLEELKKARNYWPNSPNDDRRIREIADVEAKITEIEQEK